EEQPKNEDRIREEGEATRWELLHMRSRRIQQEGPAIVHTEHGPPQMAISRPNTQATHQGGGSSKGVPCRQIGPARCEKAPALSGAAPHSTLPGNQRVTRSAPAGSRD